MRRTSRPVVKGVSRARATVRGDVMVTGAGVVLSDKGVASRTSSDLLNSSTVKNTIQKVAGISVGNHSINNN